MVSFEQLEDPQQLAALCHDRNYAITAGAGSGKTTTFAMRYLKLLETTDADPHSTAAITFTESGAAELKERGIAEYTREWDPRKGNSAGCFTGIMLRDLDSKEVVQDLGI